ncbi:MAG: GIY-YIG nuclease family protein [Nitrososphaerota archaeon]|nr:GIY-YIG nuclease family protein [Nitrososphaerota archaeon]
MHHVYVLRCRGDYLYTGYTIDLEKRLLQHNRGLGSKFTRSHLPVALVYSETFSSRSLALKRELEIKRLPRKKKLTLISVKRNRREFNNSPDQSIHSFNSNSQRNNKPEH